MRAITKSIVFFIIPLMNLGEQALAVNSEKLSLTISGHIKNQCEMNFRTGNKMDFSNEKIKSLPFDVYCNQPLKMSIYSKNGGLRLLQSRTNLLTQYQLDIAIHSIGLNASLSSEDLLSPTVIYGSSDIPFTTEGVMRVTLDENLLYAGHYEDVIEIDVYPSIHDISN